MTWQHLPLCFELLSPLHIGFLPNQPGTVFAPTRCYVPGKNLWGALTASLTPRIFDGTAKQFQQVGDEIKKQFTFSYFYLSDGKRIFTPAYATEAGLNWGGISDQEFRTCFLASRVSTRIGETGSAKDQTLHEIEFIRHDISSPGKQGKKALLVGMVWVRSNAKILDKPVEVRDGSIFIEKIDILREIVVGGERNYGFGRVKRIACSDVLAQELEKFWGFNPEAISPKDSKVLLGHLPYRTDLMFLGDIEILAGREYPRDNATVEFINTGKHISNSGYCFVPGTKLQTEDDQLLGLNAWGQLCWTG